MGFDHTSVRNHIMPGITVSVLSVRGTPSKITAYPHTFLLYGVRKVTLT